MHLRLVDLLAPPLCAVCASPCHPPASLCERCSKALARAVRQRALVGGLDETVAACPYEGTPRRLIGALKFGSRLALARSAAEAIAAVAPPGIAGATLVPVPPSPRRARRRGFDSAEEIARELAELTGLELRRCLARDSGPRQVGRRRPERLADPPRVRLSAPPPRSVALVDDVITTGATLAACARALRWGGAQTVIGLAFARSVPRC